jgi:predicted DNA-binding protein
MPETKQVILPHQERLEMMKVIVKLESTALIELAGINSDFSNRLREDLYRAINKFSEKVARTKDTGCDCVVERETDEVMPLEDALEYLGDGHGVVTPKTAYKICKAVGVPYKKELEYHGFSQHESKGLTMREGHEGDIIVDTERLSHYVVRFLNLEVPEFRGRGSQARANAEAIRKHIAKLAGEE